MTLRANPGGDACASGGSRAHAVELKEGLYEVCSVAPETAHDAGPSDARTPACHDSTAWSAWTNDSGWNPDGSPNGAYQRGWLHNYDVWSPDVGVREIRGERYPTARLALEMARPFRFALVRRHVVVCYLPTGGDYNDRGGLTLSLRRVKTFQAVEDEG